jgi:hypothetical protein
MSQAERNQRRERMVAPGRLPDRPESRSGFNDLRQCCYLCFCPGCGFVCEMAKRVSSILTNE